VPPQLCGSQGRGSHRTANQHLGHSRLCSSHRSTMPVCNLVRVRPLGSSPVRIARMMSGASGGHRPAEGGQPGIGGAEVGSISPLLARRRLLELSPGIIQGKRIARVGRRWPPSCCLLARPSPGIGGRTTGNRAAGGLPTKQFTDEMVGRRRSQSERGGGHAYPGGFGMGPGTPPVTCAGRRDGHNGHNRQPRRTWRRRSRPGNRPASGRGWGPGRSRRPGP
jgi:hypothetical protein